ncbi:MAG: LysM peptidoglycan-binding domain-containing protein [Chloroflexi bacterium]|nr:LysM peptidoglycan-binding domain-containing protein [Chloroflexota bacterium]
MGGGGGGGGLGFYKLNLNGTPVPFPTPTQSPTPNSGDYIVQEGDTLSSIAYTHNITVEELMQANGLTDTNIFVDQMLIIPGAQAPTEQKVEDLRGFLSITIHKKADGSQTTEYSLTGMDADDTFFSFPLEGSTLTELDAYNALPLLITGTARTTNGMTTINVESYKIPFPDLRFQIVKGTQKAEEIDGQTVVIFTTEDAKSYVEFMANTNQPASSFIGIQGDLIQQEVLSVPDETFGGMPVIHVYQSSIIDDNAPPMQATTNQPYVIDDTSIPEIPNYTPPNLTIEKVELVYFVSNPQYQTNDPSAGDREPYIQPVWHFYGHYSNGDEFDILIQALKEEFLLPELAPYIRGG